MTTARFEFLFIHGWTGSGPQHWQRWLADELSRRGTRVRFPDLPNDEQPLLAEWLEALDAELAGAPARLSVICHSLGCWLWLHHACQRKAAVPVRRVLLVAPPSPAWAIPELAGFPPPLDADAVGRAARMTRLVYSVDDPYCVGGAGAAFASLGLEADVIPGGAHLNTDAGYGPWPSALDWCLHETPLSANDEHDGLAPALSR